MFLSTRPKHLADPYQGFLIQQPARQWASALDPIVYQGNGTDKCGFVSECFMGWEADLAIRAKVGARDIIWVDLETGMMQPKQAFTNAGFNDAWLWTAQLRAAMIF